MIIKKVKKYLIFELNWIDFENKVIGEYVVKGMIEIRWLLGENSWKRIFVFVVCYKVLN